MSHPVAWPTLVLAGAVLAGGCTPGSDTPLPAGAALAGTWQLQASLHTQGETLDEREPDLRRPHVAAWLAGGDHARLDTALPTRGLRMRIDARGQVHEDMSSPPQVVWYDTEGIELLDDAAPFAAHLQHCGGRIDLRPAEDADTVITASACDARYPGIALRTDDADALVVDRLDLVDGRLVKTMSAVHDDAYLSRTTLVYARTD